MDNTILWLSTVILAIAIVYDQVTKGIPSRLRADQAPKSRFELVPVKIHDVPVRAGGIDIIFVHGLGSNPDTTWRASKPMNFSGPTEETPSTRDQHVNWISDFLPDDLPTEIRDGIRIFFYSYDSYWKRDAVFTRLQSVGNNLLQHIDTQIRRSKEEQGRSLIFVAHSYGGLVVKQALVQARQRREFDHIAEHTRALLFLGTPHRGSSFGRWGWLTASALQPLGSNPLILANLEYDSIELNDLHEQFLASIRDDLQVVNFYEQRPLRLLQLWFFKWQIFCVPESSATYGGKMVSKIGLPVDHYALNKFGSRNECYKSVVSKLITIIAPLVKSPKKHYAIPMETVPTFTQRDVLWNDLEEKLRKRHEKASVPFAVALHGLGGSGKSQLALKYAETNSDRYNPILWIDATSEETVRSSFARCAKELGLPDEKGNHQSTALVEDQAIQNVLRWLRDRTEVDDEWLVIVDNADDLSWGLKKVIPKGARGKLIITSCDVLSRSLVDGGCEQVPVDVMSPQEARTVLLRHLSDRYPSDDLKPPSEDVLEDCDKVANKLGYLPLAIDLAGAYIGNSPIPEKALTQYLEDYKTHQDELLQMNDFRGLSATERTVWTVWDTTLEKIEREYEQLQPGLLLTFLAHFNGTVVQDEMFRLASFGLSAVDKVLQGGDFDVIRNFILKNGREWESFRYRRTVAILIRFSLIQPVYGEWNGTTMHSLVRWRALRRDQNQQWQWWHTKFVLAACSQVLEEDHQPQFRRHLMIHLPDVKNIKLDWTCRKELYEVFIRTTVARIYNKEGRWKEAEPLLVQVLETLKSNYGKEHPTTLTIMNNLAMTYWNDGQWEDAKQLQVQVLEARKTKLGEDHPDALVSMNDLALIYFVQGQLEEANGLFLRVMKTRKAKFGDDHSDTLASIGNLAVARMYQGKWKEAEQLQIQVVETRKTTLGKDHPDTLISLGNLASIYSSQGRWREAEQLELSLVATRKSQLGEDHPDTLTSIGYLASTYRDQGRWEKAEKLELYMVEARKTKLGEDHPDTLTSIANLALIYWYQARWKEAEELQVKILETRKTMLGEDHPDTLLSMKNLASTYSSQGQWKEAEKLQVQVIDKTRLDENHPDMLMSMNNLAVIYFETGRWKKAGELQVQVMENRKTNLGKDHHDTLMSMANLASVYGEQGRWEEAEQLQIQVVETRKTKFGDDHPDTLMSMSSLASTYSRQGRWEEAEKLESHVIEARKISDDHPHALTSMNNLALIYSSQGRWKEAEKLLVQMIEASKTKLSDREHPCILKSIANLASIYGEQGRWEEAENLQSQVMEISKTKLGDDHPDTLTSMNNLASTYWNQGRLDSAEKLFIQAIEKSRIRRGNDHPGTLRSITNLAMVYSNQDRWEEAENLQIQVMEMSKTKLGDDHPDTLMSMNNLASTYWNQGRLDSAENLFIQVIEKSRFIRGNDHPETMRSIANLASTYKSQGRWKEVEQLQRQVVENRKIRLGTKHPDTLESMDNLALAYWYQGKLNAAENLFVQVMETRKTELGESHEETLTSMANLAVIWKSSGNAQDAISLLRDCFAKQQHILGPDHPATISSSKILRKWEIGDTKIVSQSHMH